MDIFKRITRKWPTGTWNVVSIINHQRNTKQNILYICYIIYIYRSITHVYLIVFVFYISVKLKTKHWWFRGRIYVKAFSMHRAAFQLSWECRVKGGSCGSPHMLSVYICVYVQRVCVCTCRTGGGVGEKGLGRRVGRTQEDQHLRYMWLLTSVFKCFSWTLLI